MASRLRIVAIGLATLGIGISGCSGSGSSTAVSRDSASTAEVVPTPSEEPTGPEQPLPQNNQPAVQAVGLPIGGDDLNATTGPDCVDVNWLGSSPGNGIAVAVDGAEATKPFTVLDAGRPCNNPPCTGHLFTSDPVPCSVWIDWPREPPGSTFEGWLSLNGHCVASDPAVCTGWTTPEPKRIKLSATLPAGSSS